MNSFLFCDPVKRHWPLDSRVWIVLKVDRCEFWFETDNTSRHLDESHLRLTFLWERPHPLLKGQCVPKYLQGFKVSQNNLPPSSQFHHLCQWSKRRKPPVTVSLKTDFDKILILFLFQCAAAALARLSRWQKPRYFFNTLCHLLCIKTSISLYHEKPMYFHLTSSLSPDLCSFSFNILIITSCLFIFINILTFICSSVIFIYEFCSWSPSVYRSSLF